MMPGRRNPPPTGEFTHAPSSERTGRYVAIAAGSGITPVLSIVASTLRDEPSSEFTLVFGNRNGASVMFLDEVDASIIIRGMRAVYHYKPTASAHMLSLNIRH